MQVKLKDIVSNGNVRIGNKNKQQSYQNLKDNIAAIGLLQPLTVMREKDKYVLVDGHQRFSILNELEEESVPVHIIENLNSGMKVAQLSANSHRIEMSLFEEVKVFDTLIKENNTLAEISDRFGHSRSYVSSRIMLNNLHPKLKKQKIFEMVPMKTLLGIAAYDKSIQAKAIEGFGNIKESWDIDQILRKCESSHLDIEEVKALFTDEELREYLKQYRKTNKTSLSIFDEMLDESIVTNTDFFLYAFSSKYPDVVDSLLELQITDEYEMDWDLREDKRIPDLVSLDFNNFTSWNNDLVRPVFLKHKLKKGKSELDTVPEEKPRFRLVDKKVARAVMNDFFNHVISALPLDPKTLEWTLKTVAGSESLPSTSSYANETYSLKNAVTEDYSLEDTGRNILVSWMQKSLPNASVSQIDKLLKTHGVDPFRTWFLNRYKENEIFRSDIMSCFTLTLLKEVTDQTGKKSDLVDAVLNDKKKGPIFQFKDLLKDSWTKTPVHFFMDPEYFMEYQRNIK